MPRFARCVFAVFLAVSCLSSSLTCQAAAPETAAAGLHVKRLKRVQEHAFKLGALPVGAWRDLTEQELQATKSK